MTSGSFINRVNDRSYPELMWIPYQQRFSIKGQGGPQNIAREDKGENHTSGGRGTRLGGQPVGRGHRKDAVGKG